MNHDSKNEGATNVIPFPREKRPRRRKADARTEVVAVRLRTDEALAFALAAGRANVTIGEWVRRVCTEAIKAGGAVSR